MRDEIVRFRSARRRPAELPVTPQEAWAVSERTPFIEPMRRSTRCRRCSAVSRRSCWSVRSR